MTAPGVNVVIEDDIAKALCDVMREALEGRGIDSATARILAERACRPIAGGPSIAAKATRAAGKRVRKSTRSARTKMSKALKEANRRLRTKSGRLRKGKTQADVMRLAQRLRRKM